MILENILKIFYEKKSKIYLIIYFSVLYDKMCKDIAVANKRKMILMITDSLMVMAQ